MEPNAEIVIQALDKYDGDDYMNNGRNGVLDELQKSNDVFHSFVYYNKKENTVSLADKILRDNKNGLPEKREKGLI